jgi:hypothetical protein
MKYIITETQLKKIKGGILKIPFDAFGGDWFVLQEYLNKRGNPHYVIIDDVNLRDSEGIETLGNLISVEGDIDLRRSSIVSLGNLVSVGGYLDLGVSNIKSLGRLTSVGDSLDLSNTKITSLGNLIYVGGTLEISMTSIESFGNLDEVGRDIFAWQTPLKSFGELKTVGGDLELQGDFLSKEYSERTIKDMIDISGNINFYL